MTAKGATRGTARAALRPSLKDRLARDSFFQTSPDLPRIVEIDLEKLAANPEQPRRTFDAAALEELAASIASHGLLQPVIVKRAGEDDGFVLVAGERRVRACRSLGHATIAAIVSAGDAGEIALIENLQRENLNPFEEAVAIERLMHERRYSQDEIGRAIGKKQNTVSALLSLNTLPERVRSEYPTSDRVSKSWLIELAAIGDESAQLRFWDRAKASPVTVRDIRAARRASPAAATALPADIVRSAHSLNQRLERLEAAALGTDERSRDALTTLHRTLGRRLGLAGD